MGHVSRGFDAPRLLGYAESHDEERLMYKNLAFGNQSNPSHNVTDLVTALSRLSALGAISITIPGPKMIWHFGALGMENSIFTCTNGSVNLPGGSDGDCKLDTKPQPQWINNWMSDSDRMTIYNDWARLITLKIEEPVFEGDYNISSGNLTPRIEIFDNSISNSELQHVIIISNFDVTTQSIDTNFPNGISSTWFDLMDNTGNTSISNSLSSIDLDPGEFRIFGNQPAVLSVDKINSLEEFKLFPNPVTTSFQVNLNTSKIEIYDITGKIVKQFEGNFTNSDKFDISDLNSGLYIIKVFNNNDNIEATKLVKL